MKNLKEHRRIDYGYTKEHDEHIESCIADIIYNDGIWNKEKISRISSLLKSQEEEHKEQILEIRTELLSALMFHAKKDFLAESDVEKIFNKLIK